MNLKNLKYKIESNSKIPSDSYSLNGGLLNEALCIKYENRHWKIYYSEKGYKSNLKTFKREKKACEYFYNYLLEIYNTEIAIYQSQDNITYS